MIYRFEPIIKTKVWGAEKWVLSGVAGNESIVADGPEKGRKLNEIYGGEFPLLVKFIDANDDLSIQVHPGDEMAARRHGCKGKTEMWVVTDADPGARLICGMKEAISPEEYASLVEQNRITDALRAYDVAPGDVFFIPAGRIHAIGAGCHIAEIQQTSDITYRIYDYNRPGMDGKPRELHTELAAEAIDYTVLDDYQTRYQPRDNAEVEVVRCPFFITSLLNATEQTSLSLEGCGEFLMVMCTHGGGTVGGTAIKAGESLLVMGESGKLSVVPEHGGIKLVTSHI